MGKSTGKILVFLIFGGILSIYISDMVGCLVNQNQRQLISSITFASILTGTIIGAAILKIECK
jgi:hypothetical protein